MNETTATGAFGSAYDRRLAAIVSSPGDQSDKLVDSVLADLQRRGVRVAGLRQRVLPGADNGCAVRLEDIQTGGLHQITQDLGSGSTSCNIDVQAVEQLALNQTTALDDTVDLLFVNRFGKRESQGAGFCCVIERAIELDIPVLTLIRESGLQAWLDYGGEWVANLPAIEATVWQWCESQVAIAAR